MEIAAETVNMGSLTTWLKRRFMATLHKQISVNRIKAPTLGQQIDHAQKWLRGAAPAASLDDSTTIHSPSGDSCFRPAGVSTSGPGSALLLMHLKTHSDIRGTFDSVDANFSVALRAVRIARGK